jgi:hypothetical protein
MNLLINELLVISQSDAFLQFLVHRQKSRRAKDDDDDDSGAPRPVGTVDVAKLFAMNLLSSLFGMGPSLGMADKKISR